MQSQMDKPHIQLAIMSRWYVVSRALHAVAKLGIANHLSSGPKKIEELAKATESKPELLHRVLRFLSSYELFNYDNGFYSLTELSKPLCDDDPHSMRDVLCMVDDAWWQAFSQLDVSLNTGTPAFELQHGDDFFSFLSKNAEKQQNFDRGMAKLSSYDEAAISNAFNFSVFSSFVDMGGGRGGLATAITKKYPELKAILFDTPAVIGQLDPNKFSNKVILQEGDFFATIPSADAYIFKGVLHDFNDEMMHKILKNCAHQMSKNATLFIAEQVMPDDDKPHPNKTMDIVMMVLLGGRQRTLFEWQKSIEPAGFIFKNSYPTNSLFTLMEFKPKK
ncbi:methyltransferase [Legionella parisiensis]|uniref:Multifunctional cyclase-dehydratase-3-O-methyl transferase TcmN n=1 Tax=Legionella parisiensis TaxID=45071 RepID=A0A1E5JPH7_9GAMM|nr:methyltransferase [Legionella parisiensis]KTD44307.1 O-methyltransferase [Legionella parisiensis]OEH45938.1 Multifunctional cyclase-dehydratase-3-O-methyl transferase TcmN [Legionella parisiensis]STX71933.1 O-methyltransferase [Legionella parisiensis]